MSLLLARISGGSSANLSASQTLAALSQSASVQAIVVAQAGQTLATLQQSASVAAIVALAAAQTLGALGQIASAAALAALAGAQTLDTLAQTANVEVVPAGDLTVTANQTLDGIAQEARIGGEERDPGTKPKPWLYAVPQTEFPAEVAARKREAVSQKRREAYAAKRAGLSARTDDDDEEILWLLAA